MSLRTWKGLAPWLGLLGLIWIIQFFAKDAIQPYYFTILMYAGVNMILAVSLNLVNGITGQFSIGHAGFMSVGAYVAAFVTTSVRAAHPEWVATTGGQDLLLFVALVVGGATAGGVGWLVGLPSLRLKGDYLAIVSLGFAEIIRVIFMNIKAVGGSLGMPNIPPYTGFGWVYGCVLVTLFVVSRLVHSARGRECLSVREDEIAAEAMGVNTTQAKVMAFVVGAFFAGVAGGLFAHQLQYISPTIFDFNRSFEVVIMVVLGGMGSISGSVIAALFLSVIREALRPLQELTKIDFRMVIYSLMLIGLMLTRPNGLFGTRELTDFLPRGLRDRFRRRSGSEPKTSNSARESEAT